MPVSITNKIDNIYVIYLLNNRNINKTLELTNITRPTLNKYIILKERLDFNLFENLDKKGNEKLTIDLALFICNNVLNPTYQNIIYPQMIQAPKKDRKDKIVELSTCDICCDTSILFEINSCCQSSICESCLLTMIETNLNDLTFTGIKCPFCNLHYSINDIGFFLKKRYNTKEFWRNTSNYHKNNKNLTWENKIYPKNLYAKYIAIITAIESHQDFEIQDEKSDFNGLLGDDHYFGSCPSCTPEPVNNRNQRGEFRGLRIGSVEKQCVNAQNEIVVLEPVMFLCIICKSRQDNFDDGEFKKCPHCGIKTVKPDGCNYIYCGDHRWCWICNERIENNSNGHNKHYHTGPGTSPYSNQCRESLNYDAPKFLIRGICDCSVCSEHNGRPLCKTLDCMNRTASTIRNPMQGEELEFYSYCQDCRMNQ